MSLSTTQYGYIIDPLVPLTDDTGRTISNGYVRVFVAGTSTPVITYKNFDGATNEETVQLDNSGRTAYPVIGSKGSTYKVCVYDAEHSQETPILTVDKIAVLGASINATGATIVTGLDSVTVQEENFIKATVEGTSVELSLDPTEVTSEVSTINAAETSAPDVVVPLLDKTGEGDSKKISLANLFKFALDWISRLATTITSFASGDFIAVSNPTDGTRKMSKGTLLELTAQNALAGNVAPAFDPTRDNTNPYKAGESVAYDGKTYTFKVDHYGAWSAGDVVPSDGLEDKISESVFESFNVSVNGTGSQVHKYVFRRIKKGSKIIFSNVNWNSPSSGYPIRFDAYMKDGTSYQMGFNYQAVAAMTSSGVYVLTATDDAEYLDLRLTATSGTSNSFTIGFMDEYTDVTTNISMKIDGPLSTGYATATRTKIKLRLQKDRMYDLSFSASFSSSILASSSLLIGIYVYSGDTFRRILTLNNTGESVPLHNYLYFNDDEDYVFIDMGLDIGTSITLSVVDITDRVVRLDSQLFRQATINNHTDGSQPLFGYKYDYAGRCTSQPSFLIPLVTGCHISSNRKNLGYRVLFFSSTGAQTSDFNDSTEVIVPNDANCIISVKSPSGSEFSVEQLVYETIIVCPSTAVKHSVDGSISSMLNKINEQKNFYMMEAINHRGYNDVAPENTLPAFRLSAVHDFDAIETDLRESSDGYFVLCHDETVDRTSNGTGNVSDKTLDQLKALDFGSWKSAEYAGTKIPTLAEALDCCYNLGLNVVIEVKYSITFEKAKELLALIEEKRMSRCVEFISFDIAALRTLAMFNNDIHIGFLDNSDSISTTFKDRIRMFDNGIRRVSAVWYHDVTLSSDDLAWLQSHGFGLERYAPGTDVAVLSVASTADGIISDRINARILLKQHEIEQ